MPKFIDIPEYVERRKRELKEFIVKQQTKSRYDFTDRPVPNLTVIQIGNDAASESYIRGKRKDCEELGIRFKLMQYDENVKWKTLEHDIQNEIDSKNIFYGKAIIIQRPVPENLRNSFVLKMIPDTMDVDGFNPKSKFNPCTAKGIIDYLDACEFDLNREVALVIGRSDIVGKPLARMLLEKNATVIQAHSHTWPSDLEDLLRKADFVFTAIDKVQYFNWKDRDDLIYTKFIDIGLGRGKDGKLHGNLSDDTIKAIEKLGRDNKAEVISGVGGVGLLTRLALMENVVDACFYGESRKHR